MPRIELLHPMIVHFPIALFFAAVGLEIVSRFTQRDLFQKIAFANYALATVAAIVAAIFGTISSNIIPHNEEIHSLMQVHQTLGWLTVAVFALVTILNYMEQFRSWGKPQIINWTLIILAAGLVTWGATLGGEMVFEQGAAVKPMYEQLEEAEAEGHQHSGSDEHDEKETDHEKQGKAGAQEQGEEHIENAEEHEETESGHHSDDTEPSDHEH